MTLDYTDDLGADLGVAPFVIYGAIAAAAGAALLYRQIQSDIADATLFNNSMKKLHSGMLGMQCILGGAADKNISDLYGNVLCTAGTKPLCTLPFAELQQWRTMRDGFGKFWADSNGFFSRITPEVAREGKNYTFQFQQFYYTAQRLCPQANLPDLPRELPELTPWTTYALWGVGLVTTIYVAKAASDIFGREGSGPDYVGKLRAAGARARVAGERAKKRLGFGALRASG